VFTDTWRVGDAPTITTSKGTTRIFLPGDIFAQAPPEAPKEKKATTHDDDARIFGVVYANALATDVMNTQGKTGGKERFPIGSIIVREKLAKADDMQPQLLAAMIKRSRGFNPKANDWEFLMIDATMTKILEQEKRGTCIKCHAAQKKRDFVFPVPAQ
jgi:hypothetical protein